MSAAVADAVLAIYQAGVDDGDATFADTAPSWIEFDRTHLRAHRYVAVDASAVVLGWIAVSATSPRAVYAGVVEHSVYVAPRARGQGVGRALLERLVSSTESAGIWTIQAGVFPENLASLALHRQAGFRVVGIRERLGQHRGRWRDVILLERRSSII